MNRLMTTRARLVAAGLATALLPLVTATPAYPPTTKTDVVVLDNGDRMTGDIKSLVQGKLSFDMSSTGIVSIKWDRVVAPCRAGSAAQCGHAQQLPCGARGQSQSVLRIIRPVESSSYGQSGT